VSPCHTSSNQPSIRLACQWPALLAALFLCALLAAGCSSEEANASESVEPIDPPAVAEEKAEEPASPQEEVIPVVEDLPEELTTEVLEPEAPAVEPVAAPPKKK
jgi:hypothetical protein